MLLLLCAQILLLFNVVGSQEHDSRQRCRQSSCARSCSCLEFKPKDCQDILQNGCDVSGVYTVFPHTLSRGVSVFCDQTTDGGGWVVFQRREDGSVNFDRNWVDYKFGFGDIDGEFWIGNELLHIMTTPTHGHFMLRVDMEDAQNQTKVAVYNDFAVRDENHRYGMVLKGYSGNAGNPYASSYTVIPNFSTDDKDSSGSHHLPYKYGGGWWYFHYSNLNGRYLTSNPDGNYALTWANDDVALKRTEIKFRQHH